MTLQLDLLNNFSGMQFCKPLEVVENKIGCVACSPRLVLSHTDTLYQPAKTGKKAGEMT
jgi:hypothetical protein